MLEANCAATARPLPGLVKLYLLQLYPATLALLLGRLILSAIGLEAGPEPVVWSIAMFALGLAGLAVIVGLHSRAAWAPGLASNLNIGLVILLSMVILRVLISPLLAYISRYSYGSEMAMILLPALLAFNVPTNWAWAKYFQSSRKLADVFGLASKEELPPLGVAFVKVVSASFLLFYIFLVISILRADLGEGLFSIFQVILISGLPAMIFPIVLLVMSSKQTKAPHFNLALWISAAVLSIWFFISLNIVYSLLYSNEPYEVINFYFYLNNVPFSQLIAGLTMALLGWKIWADPKEQAWFTDGSESVRSPRIGTVIYLLLLYFLLGILSNATMQMIFRSEQAPRYLGEWLAVLSLIVIGLTSVAFWAHLKDRPNSRLLGLAAFSLTVAVVTGISAFLVYSLNGEIVLFLPRLLSTNLPPIFLAIIGILAIQEQDGKNIRIFGGLTPTHAVFVLFAFMVMLYGLSLGIGNLVSDLIDSDNYYWRYKDEYPFLSLMLNFEFWLAYVVCPVLVIRYLRGASGTNGRILAVCGFWIFSIVGYSVTNLTKSLARGDYDVLAAQQLADPLLQASLYGIIIFMIYQAWLKKQVGLDGQ